jgi:hypothetical protein
MAAAIARQIMKRLFTAHTLHSVTGAQAVARSSEGDAFVPLGEFHKLLILVRY